MIYIVRQGQTDWNLLKKFNGSTDIELNPTGISQAESQARNLKGVNFDACFCSPQKRAVQTCKIIHKGKITFDDRLIEIDCGEFEGTPETPETLGLFWRAIKTGDKRTETYKNFMSRTCDFCDMIARDYTGANTLIVTSAANVRVMDYYFNGRPKDYDFMKTTIIKNGGLLTFGNNSDR